MPHIMNKLDMVGIALAREAKGMMIELENELNEMTIDILCNESN